MKKKIALGAKILWQIVASLVVIALIAVGILAWRLSQGPINLNPVLPYIEDSLNNQSPDINFDIDALTMEWQDNDNLIGLKAGKVIVSNRRGPFLYTPEVDINLSMRYLLLGQMKMEDIWIKRISLSLTRQKDGRIQITGQAPATEEDEPDYGVPAVVTLNNVLYDLPVLNSIRVDKARIAYRDKVAQTTRIFDPVSAYINVDSSLIGARTMSGFFTLPFDGEKTDNAITLDFATSNNPLAVEIKGRVKDTNLQNLLQFSSGLPEGWDIDMTATADIAVTLDNLWTLKSFTFDGNAESGTVTFPLGEGEDNTQKLAFRDMNALITQNADSNMMEIRTLTALLDDIVTVGVTGQLQNPNDFSQAAGDLNLKVDRLPQSWFARFWPEGDDDVLARDWLVNRIQNGEFQNIDGRIVFDMAATQRQDSSPLPPELKTVTASFAFEDMDIDYNEPMVPASKVNGRGEYKDIALSLNVDSADVGGLAVKDATLYFNDLLTTGAGMAELHFPIKGTVADVFNYIDKEPINALDKIELEVMQAKGQADLIADVAFPTVKDLLVEDVKVDVKGVLSDVHLPNALRGLTLAGGPYNIEATIDDFKMSGSGQLEGQPITLEWHEYYSTPADSEYMSLVKAKLTANAAIRRAFMKDAADYFKGSVDTDVVYRQNADGVRAKVDLGLNLKNAALDVPELGITKQSGAASTASLTLDLNDGDLKAINDLSIKGSGLSVNNGKLGFKTVKGDPVIQSATLNNMRFGENNLNVVIGTNNNLLKATISGSFLDARPILKSEKADDDTADSSDTSQPFEIGLDVDEMRTSDNATIKNVKAYARSNAMSQIERFELDAVAGKGSLYVRYTPTTDSSLSLQVEADDAGETLRAFDLYPNILGGKLRIGGKPLPGGSFGDVKGKARIDNFVVQNAPVLARLLNALSLPGILGLLEQQQLSFSRLEADFEWRLGRDGDLYIVENGTTSGASLGLTFEGSVDTKRNEMTIRGTAAPLSGINKLIGKIPIIGDILTGGDNGAVVAATYVMKGSTDDPQVSVNPLSILTPGIIRRMLFENAPADMAEPPVQREVPQPRTAN